MHVLRRKIDEAIGHLEIEDFIEALRDGGWQVADGEGRIMAWRQDVAMLVELDDRPFNSDRICGTHHDRDANAAINLKNYVAAERAETRNGRGDRATAA